MSPSPPIRLTEYSHGAGCGCKIAPQVLDEILRGSVQQTPDPKLLVGYSSRDDAAVYDLEDGRAILSTTDFFMPIVDDPVDFGRIAAANALSDVYAMGGRPLMAISVLGWPLDKLPAEVAGQVIDGARRTCNEAGIPLAGGHSIDTPEPIFGLAVTGLVEIRHLKRNDTAKPGCRLYLTKPLGVGILTTAQKKKLLKPEHEGEVRDWMCRLNRIGSDLAELSAVQALTDVTGFGFLGHLVEMCLGSGVSARVDFPAIPVLPHVEEYRTQGCIPGGTWRNHRSYGQHIAPLAPERLEILCDPQTSGGLLVAVRPEAEEEFLEIGRRHGLELASLGELGEPNREHLVQVVG
jgi:selenide,water dikinase